MSETETQTPDPETEETEDENTVETTRVAEEEVPFEATVSASTLESFFEASGAIADEMRLQLTEDGFFAAIVDPANVAMTYVDLREEGFETYRVAGEAGGMIGLNIGRVQDVLDFAEADDLVTLALDPETRKLDIEFGGTAVSLACIDPSSVRKEPDLPAIDLTVDVTITGRQFTRAIDLVDMVTDTLIVEGDPDRREWLVRGEGDTDDVEEAFGKDELIGTSSQIPGEHLTYLSVEYMQDMAKPTPNGAEVHLWHATEYPVKWTYEIGEAVEVTNVLAPRITN